MTLMKSHGFEKRENQIESVQGAVERFDKFLKNGSILPSEWLP